MASRRLTVVLDLDSGRYSGRMRGAANVTKTLQGRVDRTSKSMRGMGNSFDRAGRQMSTPLQKLRDYVLVLGNVRLALLNVRDIAVGWVGALVKQSAEVQRLTVLMKGLSAATTEFGRNEEARNNLNELFKMSRGSGIAVQSLSDSFVKMKSAGLDPTDGSLRSLVDAVSAFGGTSDTFHRASIAIQQMAGKGVISMEELRQQLGEAVPTAMFDMARAMNVSVGELVKAVSDGKVEAAPALQALFEEFELKYAGAGKRLADTFNGQMAIVSTNMLELSNSFTGLFDEMDGSTGQREGSLFSTIADNLKDLNQALQSTEAKEAMADLGRSVGAIANAIAGAIRWVIEWRNQIGALVQVIVSGFLLVQAQKLIGYFLTLGTGATLSLGNIGKAMTATQGPAAGMVAWGQKIQLQQRGANILSGQRVTAIRSEITATQQKIAQLQIETRQLGINANYHGITAKAIRGKMLAAQAALNQGKVAGRFRDFETGQYISQAKAIANNNAMIALNARAKAAASGSARQLAAAEANLTAALAAQTAAQTRLGVATTASTAKKTAFSIATGIAATAARGFGMAVNFALGPVGIIIGLLFSAASAAGAFASSADRAADAARNMANGIYTLANAERFRERLDEIKVKKAKLQGEISRKGVGRETGGYLGYSVSEAPKAHLDKRRRELAALEKEEARIMSDLGRNNDQVRAQDLRRHGETINQKIEVQRAGVSSQYQIGLQEIKNNRNLNEAQKLQQTQALRERTQASLRAIPQAAISALESSLGKVIDKHGSGSQQAANVAELLNNVTESQNSASASFEHGVEPVNNFANGLGSAGDAAGKTGKKVGATTRKVTEAEKAFKRFNTQIVSQLTKIAELEDELATGGQNSETAKLTAQLENGRLKQATEQQVASMFANAARIDQLKKQIDIADTMSKLDTEIIKVEASAHALWTGFVNDSFEAAQAAAQVEDRFADMLTGLTGDDLEAALAKVERIKQALKNEEAVEIANDWHRMAEEIEISLLNENLQRQRNFELEMERQRALIELTREGTQKRQIMEEAFARWKMAKEKELARENESSIIKMARDWQNLGKNMDEAFGTALSNLVDGLAEGELAFDDFAIEIVKSLIKVILQAIIAYAILSALGFPGSSQNSAPSFGSFLKGGIGNFLGGFGGLGGSSEVPVNHKGGILGNRGTTRSVDMSVFSGAPKFHDGGLLPGEIPIIGKEGEIILNEAQQSNVASGLKPNVQVNVINNGTDVEASVSDPKFDGKQMVVDVVLDAASKPGPMRDMLSSFKGK